MPLLVLACLVAPAASTQTQASLGLGLGTVRYAGGSTLTAAAITPALQFDAPGRSIALGGTLASLPLGVWFSQGRADIWVATPAFLGGVRLGLEGLGGGTARSDGGWSAAAHGVPELVWAARAWGLAVGAGPSGGWIANEPSVVALHTRARAWWQGGVATYSLSVEPTRFLGAWFTDVAAGLTMRMGAVDASFWASGRVSAAYGSKGAGGALVRVFPVSNLALELGGGSFLPDPYQGFPRAGYVSAGIRVFAARRAAPRTAAGPVWPPLIPERQDDHIIVRFRMDGAQSVAIAGDWDDWQPHALQSSGRDLWMGALLVSPGTYHFTLLVNGADWVVPRGVATLRDGQGGLVGVLVVRE